MSGCREVISITAEGLVLKPILIFHQVHQHTNSYSPADTLLMKLSAIFRQRDLGQCEKKGHVMHGLGSRERL